MEVIYGQISIQVQILLFSGKQGFKTQSLVRFYNQNHTMSLRYQTKEIFDNCQWFSREQWQSVNNLLERDAQDQWSFSQIIYSYETQYMNPESANFKHEDSPTIGQDEQSTVSRTKKDRNIELNYEKNICAYITKKAVQCFVSKQYSGKIKKMCVKNACDYSEAMAYYNQQYLKVFGITLLSLLITPIKQEEKGMKSTFLAFFKWFLREKYMFYLLKFGKMSEKEKYIEFKNKYMLYIQAAQESIPKCF